MMVAMIRSPSRTYLDPWTGQLFGEGGLEGNLHPKQTGGIKGGVIMSKLGNETAKYVEMSPLSLDAPFDLSSPKGSTWPCNMETTVSFIFDQEMAYLRNCEGIP